MSCDDELFASVDREFDRDAQTISIQIAGNRCGVKPRSDKGILHRLCITHAGTPNRGGGRKGKRVLRD